MAAVKTANGSKAKKSCSEQEYNELRSEVARQGITNTKRKKEKFGVFVICTKVL